jgi:hypothetical protein
MAKVRVGNPSSSILPKMKGSFYVRYDPRLGPIAQSWPRDNSAITDNAGKFYHRQEFRIAAHWAANAWWLDVESASNMAHGTMFVYRDILMKAMYGRLFEFRGPNGQQWTKARMVTANAQFTLDQITTNPGAMLYRSANGWVAIEPGNSGEVLVAQDGTPQFAAYGPSSSLQAIYSNYLNHSLPGGTTAEQTLLTTSIAAGSFPAARQLLLRAWGLFAANTHTKTIRIKLGTETWQTANYNGNPPYGWFYEANIGIRSAAPHQGSNQITVNLTGFFRAPLTSNLNFANAQTFTITGQTNTAGAADCTLEGVELLSV